MGEYSHLCLQSFIFLSPRRVSPFSRGVIFTGVRVTLALLSLGKNGDYFQSRSGPLKVIYCSNGPIATGVTEFILHKVLISKAESAYIYGISQLCLPISFLPNQEPLALMFSRLDFLCVQYCRLIALRWDRREGLICICIWCRLRLGQTRVFFPFIAILINLVKKRIVSSCQVCSGGSRGGAGGGSPLYFQTKLRPKEPKKIFCIPDPSSLSQVLDFHTKPPPPLPPTSGLISRSRSGTGMHPDQWWLSSGSTHQSVMSNLLCVQTVNTRVFDTDRVSFISQLRTLFPICTAFTLACSAGVFWAGESCLFMFVLL